jgi:hypothetical protein
MSLTCILLLICHYTRKVFNGLGILKGWSVIPKIDSTVRARSTPMVLESLRGGGCKVGIMYKSEALN